MLGPFGAQLLYTVVIRESRRKEPGVGKDYDNHQNHDAEGADIERNKCHGRDVQFFFPPMHNNRQLLNLVDALLIYKYTSFPSPLQKVAFTCTLVFTFRCDSSVSSNSSKI